MPRKRSTTEEQSTASAPTKRHRVSQACNPCRTAREKCDGTQPNCGPCIEQNRICTYTSPSKKRGIPTGYIRTVELGLAWLFEQIPGSEESLHQLLTQDGTAGQRMVLGREGKSADRLHKRWRKSKVHKEIERLLCNRDGTTPKTESSEADSDTDDGEATPNKPAVLDQRGMQPPPAIPFYGTPASAIPEFGRAGPRVIKLPSNYHRLLDIYFSYTQCWFPILERDDIMRTALTYPPEGLLLCFDDQQDSSHAQLWAVLALASFQDAASSYSTSNIQEHSLPPAYIANVAKSLIPADCDKFDVPHIRALLLLSLAALGQDEKSTAWLYLGKATRLALQLQPRQSHELDNLETPETLLIAGCFILDTLVSLSLGQYPHCRASMELLQSFANRPTPGFTMDTWEATPGFGSFQESTRNPSQPTAVFLQLYKFSALLSDPEGAGSASDSQGSKFTSEHLLRSLDPEFAYCNSLIFGGPIPMIPASFVVQGLFLTSSMILMSGRRAASLIPNFIEVVESCITNFGACGVPPILLTCMSSLQRNGFLADMHAHDKPRWSSIETAIKKVWRENATVPIGGQMYPPTDLAAHGQDTYASIPTATPQMSGHVHHGNNTYLSQHALGMHHAPTDGFAHMPLYQHTSLSPSATSPLSCTTSLKTTGPMGAVVGVADHATQKGGAPAHVQASFVGQQPSLHVDYDAILEELGSIDCTDGLDMNSQFMANLGFAPGSDLADMLHGEFGI